MSARTEAEAIELLDEVANAEGCPITRLTRLQVHFKLTDDGHLALDGFGEDREAEIFDFSYLELEHAVAQGEDVVSAVNRERKRVQVDAAASAPATDLGRRAKEQLDMPTMLVDRIASPAAKQRLKSFKPRGNRS